MTGLIIRVGTTCLIKGDINNIALKGWEYAVHRSYGDYGPEEKAFHLSRRRRRIRLRRRVPSEEVCHTRR